MKFLVTFRPNWWIIGAIFEEICIYVEENEGFGQPLIPFILLIGELQMGPYMVTYWCVSECCSLIGSHRLYVYRNVNIFDFFNGTHYDDLTDLGYFIITDFFQKVVHLFIYK